MPIDPMFGPPTVPEAALAQRLADYERRIAALERAPAVVEDLHVIGATGQPAFANGWTNWPPGGGDPYDAAGFYRDRGRVYLQGLLYNAGVPPTSAVIFTLPVGYRPAVRLIMPGCANGGTMVRLDVFPDGRLQYAGSLAAGANLSLDALSFVAD